MMTRHQHGGNLHRLSQQSGKKTAELIDFSANINPLGPPQWLRSLISATISDLVHYPDPDCSDLRDAIAKVNHTTAEHIVVANGATELLNLLPVIFSKTCNINEDNETNGNLATKNTTNTTLIPVPAYADYEIPPRRHGWQIIHFPLQQDDCVQAGFKPGFQLNFDRLSSLLSSGQLVYLGQPNNPTGVTFCARSLRLVAKEHPQTIFIVDESFIDFTDGSQSLSQQRPANVVVIKSLTKAYAIPGLRLGYAIAEPKIAELIRQQLPNWSVNTLAQQVGIRAMQDCATTEDDNSEADTNYLQRSRKYVTQQRQQLQQIIAQFELLSDYPSDCNFILIRIDHPTLTAQQLADKLLQHGIAIRVCDNFGSLGNNHFRLAVRTTAEQEQLQRALQQVLPAATSSSTKQSKSLPQSAPQKPAPQKPATKTPVKKTPAIMFQGTGSNAGKSILTAAMCRILYQDGYDVAPFKAQNMSLNSFVTNTGGEMGRAQVVQAQACRLDADVRMNPVLLKPNSDTGSQVILLGKTVGNMHFRDYAKQRQEIFRTVKSTYDELAAEHQIMVLEGAGSPAEINLKSNDIVNMNMARYADAAVLLVGDIDRGGVFASFVGTMELLTEAERAQVLGFVINRFRGDASLLNAALLYTKQHTGCPVLGTVPYLHNLGLPEEDSVSFKDGRITGGTTDQSTRDNAAQNCIDIAIIDLPHISNFTDFDPLTIEPDLQLRVIKEWQQIGSADAVIIPGSKNVIGDLEFLHQSGFADKLLQLAANDSCEIIGICGGLQILGHQISDPHHIESAPTTTSKQNAKQVVQHCGLGLLPVATVLDQHKTTVQSRCIHQPSGLELRGYEIHHGQTSITNTDTDNFAPIAYNVAGELLGGSVKDGRIWGTYLHGVFDADQFRRWFIDNLRQRRGWATDGKVQAVYDLEPAFDRLADSVRQAVDMDTIYRSIGL